MTKRARRILFLAFLAGFLVSAPAVVLYTAGYRYHFGTGQLVQTGVLSVSSVPRGANIAIDGERLRSTTPALVKNVLPGDHDVRVERDGYSSWEKTLPVNSRETTFADDVVLFLEGAPEPLRETALRAVSVNPADGRAAYAQSEGPWTEVWLHDPSSGSETLVSRLPLGNNETLSFAWPADGTALSITAAKNGVSTTTLVNLATGAPMEAPAVSDVRLSATGDRVVVSRHQGESNEILAYLPAGSYAEHDAPSNAILLADAARGRLVLVNAAGGDQPILLNVSATYWQWQPGGARLLYSDGFDLHVYDAASHTDETVTRLSSAITGVAWYPDHSYVLYAQADAIYATELDHRDGRNVTRIAEGANLGAFAPLPNGRDLLFFGTVGGTTGLFSRALQR